MSEVFGRKSRRFQDKPMPLPRKLIDLSDRLTRDACDLQALVAEMRRAHDEQSDTTEK